MRIENKYSKIVEHIKMPVEKINRHFRLSKKSSFCWAFSIFYDIIHMGDENA